MKKLNFKIFTLLSCLFVVSITSCRKETSTQLVEIQKNDEIFVKDGILVFKNDSIFSNYFASLGKGDAKIVKDLSKIKAQFNFVSQADTYRDFLRLMSNTKSVDEYNSVLSQYEDIVKLNSDSTFSLKNGSYSFSEILNRKGLFIIGKEIINYSTLITKHSFTKKRNSIKAIPVGAGLIKEMIFTNSNNNRKNVVQLRCDIILPNLVTIPKYDIYLKAQQYQKNFFGKWVNSTAATYSMSDLNYGFSYNASPGYDPFMSGFNLSSPPSAQPYFLYYITYNLQTISVYDLDVNANLYSSGITTPQYFYLIFR